MEENLEALAATLSPEKKAVYATWSAARDEYTNAEFAAAITRNDWAALFGTFDRKVKARDDRDAAERDLHKFSRKLGIKTLPLSPDALQPLRAEAEASAHERLKLARQALIVAEQALEQAKTTS